MNTSCIELDPASSNRDLILGRARAGCIGLCSVAGLFTRAVQRAERTMYECAASVTWSHAFVFQGIRADGHIWVIESDLEIHRRNVRLGVQENRADKFFDEKAYPCMAVLDFGLTPVQTQALLLGGLDMVSGRIRYSLRELVGVLTALRVPKLRADQNRFGSDKSIYCSALVLHLFRQAGVDLVPGVHPKRTTPGDLARTVVPHTAHVLKRAIPRRRAR